MIEITPSAVLAWLQEERTRLPENVLCVTEVCSCLRKAYLQRRRPITLHHTLTLQALGKGFHRELQRRLKREGWHIEVKCKKEVDDFRIIGLADAYDPAYGIVLEIKTSKNTFETPPSSWVLQLQAYMCMLHADIGFIVNVSRSNGRVRTFKVKRDPVCLGEIIARARILYRSLVKHRAPRPEPSPLCSDCPYRLVCRTLNR